MEEVTIKMSWSDAFFTCYNLRTRQIEDENLIKNWSEETAPAWLSEDVNKLNRIIAMIEKAMDEK